MFLEKYACHRIKVSYFEKYLYNPVGKESYQELFEFKLSCEVFRSIVDTRFRVIFRTPVNDPDYTATFTNDNPRIGRQISDMTKEELRTVTYVRSNAQSS